MLIAVCDKLINISENEKPTLSFVHDYLESRLELLRTVNVSQFPAVTDLLNVSVARDPIRDIELTRM